MCDFHFQEQTSLLSSYLIIYNGNFLTWTRTPDPPARRFAEQQHVVRVSSAFSDSGPAATVGMTILASSNDCRLRGLRPNHVSASDHFSVAAVDRRRSLRRSLAPTFAILADKAVPWATLRATSSWRRKRSFRGLKTYCEIGEMVSWQENKRIEE